MPIGQAVEPTRQRESVSRGVDVRPDVKLLCPGAAGAGANPEQLFAAGPGLLPERDAGRRREDEDCSQLVRRSSLRNHSAAAFSRARNRGVTTSMTARSLRGRRALLL